MYVSEAFKQRRDYLALQVEVCTPLNLRAGSSVSVSRGFLVGMCWPAGHLGGSVREDVRRITPGPAAVLGDAQGRKSPDPVVKLDRRTVPHRGQGKLISDVSRLAGADARPLAAKRPQCLVCSAGTEWLALACA